MPDWLTHSITGWVIGRAWKKRVSIVVIGALLPDLVKIQLIFDFLNIDTHHFFDALHTPITTIFVALAISTLFPDIMEAFILFYAGALSHYFLDFFLEHPYGGMRLFYPFSWNEYQLHLIPSTNYWMTIIAVIIGFIFYIIFKR